MKVCRQKLSAHFRNPQTLLPKRVHTTSHGATILFDNTETTCRPSNTASAHTYISSHHPFVRPYTECAVANDVKAVAYNLHARIGSSPDGGRTAFFISSTVVDNRSSLLDAFLTRLTLVQATLSTSFHRLALWISSHWRPAVRSHCKRKASWHAGAFCLGRSQRPSAAATVLAASYAALISQGLSVIVSCEVVPIARYILRQLCCH